jgi:hypothetical protein
MTIRWIETEELGCEVMDQGSPLWVFFIVHVLTLCVCVCLNYDLYTVYSVDLSELLTQRTVRMLQYLLERLVAGLLVWD